MARSPRNESEAETRRTRIDPKLAEQGWQVVAFDAGRSTRATRTMRSPSSPLRKALPITRCSSLVNCLASETVAHRSSVVLDFVVDVLHEFDVLIVHF